MTHKDSPIELDREFVRQQAAAKQAAATTPEAEQKIAHWEGQMLEALKSDKKGIVAQAIRRQRIASGQGKEVVVRTEMEHLCEAHKNAGPAARLIICKKMDALTFPDFAEHEALLADKRKARETNKALGAAMADMHKAAEDGILNVRISAAASMEKGFPADDERDYVIDTVRSGYHAGVNGKEPHHRLLKDTVVRANNEGGFEGVRDLVRSSASGFKGLHGELSRTAEQNTAYTTEHVVGAAQELVPGARSRAEIARRIERQERLRAGAEDTGSSR